MRSFLAGVGLGALLLCGLAVAAFASEDPVARGARVFQNARPSCRTCHNPQSYPLDGYGRRGSPGEARAWITQPDVMFKKTGKRGKKPRYKMPPGDLDALVAFVMSR